MRMFCGFPSSVGHDGWHRGPWRLLVMEVGAGPHRLNRRRRPPGCSFVCVAPLPCRPKCGSTFSRRVSVVIPHFRFAKCGSTFSERWNQNWAPRSICWFHIFVLKMWNLLRVRWRSTFSPPKMWNGLPWRTIPARFDRILAILAPCPRPQESWAGPESVAQSPPVLPGSQPGSAEPHVEQSVRPRSPFELCLLSSTGGPPEGHPLISRPLGRWSRTCL